MRALAAAATALLVLSGVVYAYSLTLDVSTTTSDQNLVQFLAGLLLLGAAACASAYGLVQARRRDRRDA